MVSACVVARPAVSSEFFKVVEMLCEVCEELGRFLCCWARLLMLLACSQ